MEDSGRPLRLLVLSLNYAPEAVGIAVYSADLARTMAARGHRVEVIGGQAFYPEWRRHRDQPAPGLRVAEQGVGVVRVRHYIPAVPSGIKRVAHLVSFSLMALLPALRRARKMRPHVVFVTAPSLLSVPVAWLAAKVGGAKLWVHVQDFEVEAAFATGQIDRGSRLAKFALGIENRLLGLADRVSTISPQMLAKLADKGVPPARTFELRNWANADFAPDPHGADRYRSEWGLGDRRVALYSGNIAQKQGIEIILDVARRLAGRDDLAFVICGNGPNRTRLEMAAADLGNVRIADLQPAERMGGLLALADVHLLPQIAGAADLVLPSKLTNMLISGRPVVATAAPGTGLYDEVEGCGIATPPGDATAMAAALTALIDDPALAARCGAHAAVRAGERWNRDAIIDRFETDVRNLAMDSLPEQTHAK